MRLKSIGATARMRDAIRLNSFITNPLTGDSMSTVVEPVFKFITKTDLLARGWTQSLIRKFLVQPDKRIPNPHSKRAPKTHLYSMTRVQQAEASEAFATESKKLQRRREAALDAAAERMAYLDIKRIFGWKPPRRPRRRPWRAS